MEESGSRSRLRSLKHAFVEFIRPKTVAYAHDISPVYVQSGFLWRNDNGTLVTATSIAAQNTNPAAGSLSLDTNYRMRFEVEETASATLGTFTPIFEYRVNTGGGFGAWTRVNSTSSYVRSSASANVADNAATANLITTSARTFQAGAFDEVDGALAAISGLSNENTEVEFCFQLRSADFTVPETVLELRVSNDAVALTTYSQTPSFIPVKVQPEIVGSISVGITVASTMVEGRSIDGAVTVTPTVSSAMSYTVAGAHPKQVFLSSSLQNDPVAGTSHTGIGVTGDDWTLAEFRGIRMQTPGTFRNLGVGIDVAPGSGASRTYALSVNGIGSAITATISDGEFSAEDVTNEVHVDKGDYVTYSHVVSAGIPADTGWHGFAIEFEPDDATSFIYGKRFTVTQAATRYMAAFMSGAPGTTLASEESRSPMAMTITGFGVDLHSNVSGTGETVTFQIQVNGTPVGSVLTINSGSAFGEVTGQSISVAEGDHVSYVIIGSAASGSPTGRVGLTYTPAVAGESVICGGSSNVLSATATEYNLWAGRGGVWSPTANYRVRSGPTPWTMRRFQAELDIDPGDSPDSYVLRPTNDRASLNSLATITADDLEAIDTVNTDEFTSGMLLEVQSVPMNTPSATPRAWWSAIMYIDPGGGAANYTIVGAVTVSPAVASQMVEGRVIDGQVTVTPTVESSMVEGRNIDGDVTVTPTVAATMLEGRVLAGGITVTSTVSSSMVEGRTIDGAVTVTTIPSSSMIEGRVLEGAVTVGISISADMLEGREIVGQITVTATVESGLIEGRVLVGEVTVNSTVASEMVEGRSISGDVTVVPTVSSTMLEGRVIDGAVTVNFTIAATMNQGAANHVVIDGDVTVAVAVAASMIEGRVIVGDVTVVPSISSSMFEGRTIDGDVTVVSTISSGMVEGRAIIGAVTVDSVIASTMLEGRVILGDITVLSTVESNMIHQAANSNAISGSVTVLTTIAASMVEGRVIEGSVTLTAIPAASMFEGREIVGSGTIVPTVQSTMIEGRVFVGQITVVPTIQAMMFEGRSITGSVLVLTTIESVFDIERHPSIIGSVLVGSIIQSAMIEGRSIVGDVTVVITPQSQTEITVFSIVGMVTVTILVAAAMEFAEREWVIISGESRKGDPILVGESLSSADVLQGESVQSASVIEGEARHG